MPSVVEMSPSPSESPLFEASYRPDTPPSSYGSESGDSQDLTQSFSVHLPDLFSSIMSVDPVVNPNYEKVKAEADNWISRVFNLTEEKARKNAQADFAYMNAIWAPKADDIALRVMIDWHHWVFAFDDQFDEGHLNSDPVKAAEEIIYTLALLDDVHPIVTLEENPLRHVFQHTWFRYRERSSRPLQARYKSRVRQYCLGVLSQVGVKQNSSILSVEEYMNFRRGSIGTYPSFSLIEYAHGIDLPQEIIDHPSIGICEEVASDLVILVNDLLSYRKDLEQGVEHNIIILFREQGYTTQQAVDKIGHMLEDAYRRWYRALAELPTWGEKIDKEVLKYIDGCRNVALGNLHWSYASRRYLGDEGKQIRHSRILSLPAEA
ncbi:isoprenoid synthase domain-containing protein [Xylariaceae sp. FL0662B]|nr:isoprenoid synthase domain-containing protein [Xylariaceae sp. FL0662B]